MEIENGKITAIFGDSGSGKTSILNIIAGISEADGSIEFDGENWLNSKKKISLKPQERSISYVFQEDTLFPNMTLMENLEYASRISDKSILKESLNLFGLGDYADKKPKELSGGQIQRANICRGLLLNKKILLLDEPIKAVEQEMRQRILQKIQKKKNTDLHIIFVSHQKSEIFGIADYVYEIVNGKVKSKGTPEEVFNLDEKHNFKLSGIVLKKGKDSIFVETSNGVLEIDFQEEIEIGSELVIYEENTKLKVKRL